MNDVEALRYNDNKPELHRIMQFDEALDMLAAVMAQGAIKYDDGNWLHGNKPDREYIDSMLRHLSAHVNNYPYDAETGCMHLAHVAWNALACLRLNYRAFWPINTGFNQEAFEERWSRDGRD